MPGKLTVAEMRTRFWARVRVVGSGCWEWTGLRSHCGYGTITWGLANGRNDQQPAHRASWEMFNGPIPDGLWVLHRCDNPPCVNPAHLFLGTATDNNADMDRKGRRRVGRVRGSMHHASTLTEDEVRYIKSATHLRPSVVARQLGIRAGHVRNIRRGLIWGHIPVEPVGSVPLP